MPSNALASYKVLRTLLSQFCYERNLFPVQCFRKKKLINYSVHVIKKELPEYYPSARYLECLLDFGVQECLQRDCLIAFHFDVVDLNNHRIIETFTFNRTTIAPFPSLQDLDELLRELATKHDLLLQTLNPICTATCFSIRLELEQALVPFPSWIPPFFCKDVAGSSERREDEKFVELEIGCCVLGKEQYRFQVESSRDGAANLQYPLVEHQMQQLMTTKSFVSTRIKSMMRKPSRPKRFCMGESPVLILSHRPCRDDNKKKTEKRSLATTNPIKSGGQRKTRDKVTVS
uniref:AlNc14C59G4379 protein n=1 Tax=Albugo laibachii Nc14 TaxID=890382 RepID=F0WCJ9_9STRA|nr:AlNc14C59G4379 [Albugo laibachii Nc14]|eukprot:CCA18916.1 AlNc14C59G4379 [Albugo laibachii Nc14]